MQESNNKIYSSFQKTVINFVPNKPNLTILDLGCGTGETGMMLKQKYGAKVFGVSISEKECEISNQVLEKCYQYDLENGLPFNFVDTFDVVLLSHVLEHICYPEKLLEDLKKVLKQNGIIIVALPNIMHYNSRLKLLLGNFEYTDKGIYDYTHFRWYTFKSAERLFNKHGFKTSIKDVTVSLPFGRILNRIKNEKIKIKITQFLKNISKGFFGWELVYVFQLSENEK